MKVLFAVNDEKDAESITRVYQEEYKEIISSKTVYYFNAIIKELQKDKTYDRVVISEDLEMFANSNYQAIDKFIFEKMDAISDEATNVEGNDIPIILLCVDRRTKNDPLLAKLFGLGLYNVLIGQDRSVQKVCSLMYKPRTKKEAKLYYKVEAEKVNYKAENANNGVSETEIQNILNHYKRIGNNVPKCVQSFESIANQYSKDQIKLIIEVLPVNVKVILEENSDLYRKIIGIKGKKSVGESELRKSEYVEKKIDTGSRLTKPVIIPATVNTKKVTKMQNQEKLNQEKALAEAKRKEEEKRAKEKAEAEARRKEEERIAKEKAEAEAKKKELERIEKENAEKMLEENEIQTVKRGRGRPRKNPVAVEEPAVKKKRGRPRKTEIIEEEKEEEDLLVNAVLDNEENIDFLQDDDEILPGFEDYNEDEDFDLLDEDEELDDDDFELFDDEELEDEDFDLLDEDEELDDEELNDDDYDLLDEDEELDDEDYDLLDEDEELEDEDYDLLDEDEELDDDDYDLLDEDEEIEEEDVLPGFEEENEEEDEILPGFEEYEEETEEEMELPGLDNYEEDIEDEILEAAEDEEDYDYDDDEIEEQIEDELDDDMEEIEGTNEIDEEELEKQHNGSFKKINNKNYKYDDDLANSIKDLQETEENTSYNVDTDNLITSDQKVVAFVGTAKNGTSFIVNNLAETFSNKGIKTAILDLTKNKNSYYIYTNNEDGLRQKAHNCLEKLVTGVDDGVVVNKNLTVFTSLPGEDDSLDDVTNVIKTLLQNYTIILLDCDFNTDVRYFKVAQEVYLVQSLDVLTIQPLTAFLRDLKVKGILETNKLRIIINKNLRINSITDKILIGGMSVYNDPGMTYMTELFNRDTIKYTTLPFEEQVYVKYLDGLVNCKISSKGYSKNFMASLNNLCDMVYPTINGKKQKVKYNDFSNKTRKFEDTFSKNTSSTLDKMKKKF